MLEAGEGKTIVDLGSGDGTFLLAAAKRGATVYGYELNPLLCGVSWLRCRKYRQQVHIKCANFWRVQLPEETTGVYVFLITRFMRRLDQKMEGEVKRLGRPLKLASFTFPIPGKQAIEAKEAVFLYDYSPKKQ
jgi:SAM-dependent methyltransferase